jgi:signal transduction histidine kinase
MHVETQIDALHFDYKVALVVIRITQEALNNAI